MVHPFNCWNLASIMWFNKYVLILYVNKLKNTSKTKTKYKKWDVIQFNINMQVYQILKLIEYHCLKNLFKYKI